MTPRTRKLLAASHLRTCRRTLGAITILLFCLVLATGCSEVRWRPDLGGAMRLAAERNQMVLVAYWSALNPDCQRMEREVFTNPAVREALRGAIPVRLDALLNRRFAETYGLRTVPSFIIFAPDGRILRTAEGYADEGRFRGIIESSRFAM